MTAQFASGLSTEKFSLWDHIKHSGIFIPDHIQKKLSGSKNGRYKHRTNGQQTQDPSKLEREDRSNR